MVHVKMHPTHQRVSTPSPRRFGQVLVSTLFTQNLVSIVLCAFKRIKGRLAFALDTFERAALCGNDARLFGAVQPSLFELRLDKRLWGHSPKGVP
jgi:hypothetical protein